MTRPLPRSYLVSRGFCCNNGCFNCPYKHACQKCNQINLVSLDAQGFICWNCGQGSVYTLDFESCRTENNSLDFEDGLEIEEKR